MKNDLLKRAVRLYGRCVLATVMGTFMYFSVGIIALAFSPRGSATAGESMVINVIALLLQCFLSFTMIYAEMWTQGDKDGGPVLFGGKRGDPHLGLKVALLSVVPALVGYALLIVEKLVGFWPQYIMLYRAANFTLYPIMVWTMGADWGVPAASVSWTGVLLSIIPTVIIVLVAWGSYYVGYRQFTFAQKLMYKNDKSKRNKLR